MGFLNRKRVCISGGFDPIHVGHIRYIREAAKLGEHLIVILNSDRFLMEKKGYVFMPFDERKEILLNIKGITDVFPCVDLDNTVCKTLQIVRPNIFAKGGDRVKGNVPEEAVCRECKIRIKYGVGGYDKPQSSSWLVSSFNKKGA